MRLPGRLSAAIEILGDFNNRSVPFKTAMSDWGRNNRYAGAKDRAWISGLCLDVLRQRQSLSVAMGDDSARALVLGALKFLWGVTIDDLAEAATGEHGPGALSAAERETLSALSLTESGDYPEWLTEEIARVFGDDAAQIMSHFATRADVDLRLNTLKAAPEKSLAALNAVNGEALPILTTSARIAAPAPHEKAPGITVIPAFSDGWVEVQDLGSQIAAAAAGDIKGKQVLDYCAGGGGKTLALAAMMGNTGQLHAYDKTPRRLMPLVHRAKRAGLRNLTVHDKGKTDNLKEQQQKMDVVFVDAPCTGAGTWRRHPDTKWRLAPRQLEQRRADQDQVLKEASVFVKPGGRMVWVTCSFLMAENEDRLAQFLDGHPDFKQTSSLDAINASGLLTQGGADALGPCATAEGALRLTPDKIRADGFFIAVLERESA